MSSTDKKYSDKEILALAEALKKNESSFKWLLDNNCIELAALADAMVFGKDTALDWLKKNGYLAIEAFSKALDGSDASLSYLMNNAHREWAAVISVVNDDDQNALIWLMKSHLKQYVALAATLKELAKSSGGSGGAFLGGGESGGGGFGGFGGGSFGGAGAGALW